MPRDDFRQPCFTRPITRLSRTPIRTLISLKVYICVCIDDPPNTILIFVSDIINERNIGKRFNVRRKNIISIFCNDIDYKDFQNSLFFSPFLSQEILLWRERIYLINKNYIGNVEIFEILYYQNYSLQILLITTNYFYQQRILKVGIWWNTAKLHKFYKLIEWIAYADWFSS